MLSTYSVGPAIFRLRATSIPDSDGDPVESWASPDRRRLYRADFQVASATEGETPAAARLRDEGPLYVPGRVDLLAGDRVEVGGLVYDVIGDPVVAVGEALGVNTTAQLRRVRTAA